MFTPFLLVIFRSMDYMDKDTFPKAHGEGNIGKGKGIWTEAKVQGEGHRASEMGQGAEVRAHG